MRWSFHCLQHFFPRSREQEQRPPPLQQLPSQLRQEQRVPEHLELPRPLFLEDSPLPLEQRELPQCLLLRERLSRPRLGWGRD
jgi:hypothetical protein